ncbi:MAG: hypothetical protein R6V54_04370 [Desulfobacteraceae bacterium]
MLHKICSIHFIALGLFFLLLLAWSPVHGSEKNNIETIVSFGKRAIAGDELPQAKKKAVSDALDLSVQRAVAGLLKGEDITAALGIVYEQILNDSQRYVSTYRVLGELTDNGHYIVAVEAKVDVGALERFFTDYGILDGKGEKPSILLMISEQVPGEVLPRYWWGKNPLSYKSTARTALAESLKKQGFDRIFGQSEKSLAALEKNDIRFDSIHDADAAVKLAALVQADMVVVGKALVSQVSNIMGNERTYKAGFSVDVFPVNGSAASLASFQTKGVAKSRVKKDGVQKALASAGKLAGEKIGTAIAREWSQQSSHARAIEVTIEGSDYLSNFIMLRRVLNKMEGIDDVQTKELGSKQAMVDIVFKGPADKLADALMLETFDDFALEIFDVSANSLAIRFIRENGKEPVSASDLEDAYISE